MSTLATVAAEGLRYKGRWGQLLWIGHRLSGLGVVVFLITHVFGMSMSYFSPSLHESMLNLYKTPFFSLGELVLAVALIFHAVNGTRIAILELRPQLWEKQEVATRYALIVTLVLAAPTILIMLGHTFGLIGGK